MKYKISEKRAEFLKDKFFEYSFKGIDLDTKTLTEISEPIELDFIARNHNYDDGNDILIHIIKNPNCDFSTVKMIFHRADLNGFLNLKEKSQDSELIKIIVQNSEKNFYENENFYYNPNEDSEILEFDFETAKKSFPSILFGKPKGRKIEPNFAEKFNRRNISTIQKNNIEKSVEKILVKTPNSLFEFNFAENFELISDDKISSFIENYKFPKNLENAFSITENQLKNVIINPEIALKNKDLVIVLFLFNCQSLRLENALTNVVTIMRNEFVYIQAFIQITGVEENFDKIRRIKSNENWFALSKGMQVKIENFKSEKYLKLLLVEKDEILFHFSIISNSIENLENEEIQELIINHIKI